MMKLHNILRSADRQRELVGRRVQWRPLCWLPGNRNDAHQQAVRC